MKLPCQRILNVSKNLATFGQIRVLNVAFSSSLRISVVFDWGIILVDASKEKDKKLQFNGIFYVITV